MSEPLDESDLSEASELDRATKARLGRLRSMPIDMSGLNAWAEREIPKSRPETIADPNAWAIGGIRVRPARLAIAAMLMLVLGAGLMLALQSQPAMASPTELAKVHADMIAGKMDVSPVESIDQANRLLAVEHGKAPALPMVKCDKLMSCCMRRVHETSDKKMSCLLFSSDGKPVTLAVASSRDVRPPASAAEVVRDGKSYRTQSSGTVNMVMTEHAGRWVCLMGEVPTPRLFDLATSLRF